MLIAGTEEVGELGGAALRERHPGLALTVRSGHFDAAWWDANSASLRRSRPRPHLLLVGMGMPRQEHWIAANHQQITAAW